MDLGPKEPTHLARLEIMYEHLDMDRERAGPLGSHMVALFAGWLGELLAELDENRSLGH